HPNLVRTRRYTAVREQITVEGGSRGGTGRVAPPVGPGVDVRPGQGSRPAVRVGTAGWSDRGSGDERHLAQHRTGRDLARAETSPADAVSGERGAVHPHR